MKNNIIDWLDLKIETNKMLIESGGESDFEEYIREENQIMEELIALIKEKEQANKKSLDILEKELFEKAWEENGSKYLISLESVYDILDNSFLSER